MIITNEEIKYDGSVSTNKTGNPVLGRLYGPCADIVNPTRNGRRYSNALWEKVFSDPIVIENFQNGGIFGELGHPVDRQEIDMEKIAICMPEPPKKTEDGYVGSWDILDTPNGRILNTLCKYGYKIGISSRGSGEVYTAADGCEEVDPDQYDFACFDAVLLPAVKAARLEYVAESLTNKKTFNEALNETLIEATEDEKKIMLESLNNLNITYQSVAEELDEESNETDKTVNHIEDSEDLAVENVEAENESELNEALEQISTLQATNIELQEKLSVSYAKENTLNEQLAQYKETITKLSQQANQVSELQETLSNSETRYKKLVERLSKTMSCLTDSKQANNVLENKYNELVESCNKDKETISSLNESVETSNKNSQREIKSLNEKLQNLQKDLNLKQKSYSQKLTKANQLVEHYKELADAAVNKYVESKASHYGLRKDNVFEKLPENYTFDDVDTVCESLRKYVVSTSKLPFQATTLKEGLNIKVKNVHNPSTVSVNEADLVDDSLLSLAGIND